MGRTKHTHLGAQYRRMVARRGRKRAAVAVGHSILTTTYYRRKRAEPYQDLGSDFFEQHDRQGIERGRVHRLEHLGYEVTREEAAGSLHRIVTLLDFHARQLDLAAEDDGRVRRSASGGAPWA